MGWHLRKPTLVEVLLLGAIVTVVVAILLPAPKWAASGSVEMPVRVLVFDAVSARPIANARVGIFRASLLDDLKSLEERPDEYSAGDQVEVDDRGTTSADGAVVIHYEFTTGANYERPTTYVQFQGVRVIVEAEGYDSVVAPVRYESHPTAPLQAQEEVLVSVDLRAKK